LLTGTGFSVDRKIVDRNGPEQRSEQRFPNNAFRSTVFVLVSFRRAAPELFSGFLEYSESERRAPFQQKPAQAQMQNSCPLQFLSGAEEKQRPF
jgi:hypothetical protein